MIKSLGWFSFPAPLLKRQGHSLRSLLMEFNVVVKILDSGSRHNWDLLLGIFRLLTGRTWPRGFTLLGLTLLLPQNGNNRIYFLWLTWGFHNSMYVSLFGAWKVFKKIQVLIIPLPYSFLLFQPKQPKIWERKRDLVAILSSSLHHSAPKYKHHKDS